MPKFSFAFSLIAMIFVGGPKTFAANNCLDLFAYSNPSLFENHSNNHGGLTFHDVPLDVTEFNPKNFDVDLNLMQLIQKSMQIQEKALEITDPRHVKTVVYPASGYDAGTAFVIFPYAETVIGFDPHNFIAPGLVELHPSTYLLEETDKFSYVGDINNYSHSSSMASALLKRLMASIPLFRLIRVVEVREGSHISHGWIEFDQGPGTLHRRYIHINHFISRLEPSHWSQSLASEGFQGLLIKAALGVMNPQNAEGSFLLNTLRAQGGVVIDADGTTLESQVATLREYGVEPNMDYYPGIASAFAALGTHVSLGYDEVPVAGDVASGVKVIYFKGDEQ